VIFYLTFNDAPSGIFSSQVIDVVKFLSTELKAKTTLIAFISIRNFFANRKKIISELPDSLVLPMIPGVGRWKYNLPALKVVCAIKKPSAIIGRSVLATNLAMETNVPKIVYDGRGAIAAEWSEYNVVNHKKLQEEIFHLEKKAVLNSSYRIAVSNELVKYWEKEFNYTQRSHSVIPCTLNKVFEELLFTEDSISTYRSRLSLHQEDIIFVYSGSIAGWQSFNLLYDFVKPVLSRGKKNKLLFLSDKDENILKLENEFANQIICKKVKPSEVPSYLAAADYGLLIREKSVTNKVASPVKFAEYLACGLKVIISDELGDYTDFVIKNNCGYRYQEFTEAKTITLSQKQTIRLLALRFFTKKTYTAAYQQVISYKKN